MGWPHPWSTSTAAPAELAIAPGALIHEGETREGPVIGTPYIDGFLTYRTRIPATGSLLWFSPAANVAPTPVAKQTSGRGEIVAPGIALLLERRGDAWFVTAK